MGRKNLEIWREKNKNNVSHIHAEKKKKIFVVVICFRELEIPQEIISYFHSFHNDISPIVCGCWTSCFVFMNLCSLITN